MNNITKFMNNCSIAIIGNCSANASTNSSENTIYYVDPVYKKAHDTILVILMIFFMLSLGCTIELSVLKQQIRRPIGVAVGLLCQFILFPAVTFGLAHALNLEQWDALGMIILGTCPGGSISNVATYWSNGDITLSVIMTAVSTAVGTGMMPLNLWIYSRSWTDKKAVVPYVNIVIALLSILVPVAIGMVIMYKFPKPAKWIAKIGSGVGLLVVAVVIILNFMMYSGIYISTPWVTWFGALLLPCVGLVIGYVLAVITRRPPAQRRAIAIETSAQNVVLCYTLISITFDGEDVSRLVTYPSLFGCSSVFILTTLAILFRLYDYRTKRNFILEINKSESKKKSNKPEAKPQTQIVTVSLGSI